MIGAQVSTSAMMVTDSIVAIFGEVPVLVGDGRIGSELRVAVTFADDVTPHSVSYQWYGAGALLADETGPTLAVGASLDETALKCVVSAGLAGRVETVETIPVVARHTAPTGPVDLPEEIFDLNSGMQQIDVSGAFTGSDLSYALAGATGVDIDPVTGLLTVQTNRGEGLLELTISARNSGGVWSARLSVTLEEQPQADQVLDLTATDTALTLEDPGFPQSDIDGIGIWISAFVFYPGSGEANPRLAGLANSSSGANYIDIRTSSVALRNGGATFSLPNLDTLTLPGWYLVTARIWKNLAGDTAFILHRNDGVSETGIYRGNFSIATFNRLGWGMLPDTTPKYGSAHSTGMAWGRGDPLAYHTAIYDGGAFKDPASYDFDADSGVVLLGYEAGAKLNDGGVTLEAATLTQNWNLQGSPRWADLPPPYVGGAFGSLESLAIAPTATGETFEVVTDLFAGAWGVATVELSRVTLWASRGYGSLSVTGASVATDGPLATVTFTLSRRVFVGEEIRVQLDDAWITDNARNRGSGTIATSVTNLSQSPVPDRVSGLSHGQVAFDFAAPYEAGITADGIMWARDDGNGVNIARKLPAQSSLTQGGAERVIHGTMQNPQRRSDNVQGYTSVGTEADDRFDPALAVDFPVTLVVNESLVGTVGNVSPFALHGGRSGHPVNIAEYQGLIVTDFVPGPDDFPPPLVGYDASNRPAWASTDVSAIAASLPAGYDTTGFDRPDPEIVINRIDRFHPSLLQFGQVEMKREMTPGGFTNADGYGVNFIATTTSALLMLVDAATGAQQRERIVRCIVHHYRQWYGVGKLSANGGHNQGALGFLVLGDYWINGGVGIPTMLEDMGGNESKAFRIANQAELERITLPHDATPGWPRFSQRSTLSSVNGNQITIERMSGLRGSTLRDATRELGKLILVRETDGAEAAIVDYDDDTGVLSLAANGHGFSVGDPIYCKAPWTQAVGDYEWVIRTSNGMEEYTPSRNAVYRNLNQWSGEVLAMRALGLIHPSMDAVQGYVELANASDLPTPENDFPDAHVTFVYGEDEPASGASRWARSFWNTHWDTVRAVPQLF